MLVKHMVACGILQADHYADLGPRSVCSHKGLVRKRPYSQLLSDNTNNHAQAVRLIFHSYNSDKIWFWRKWSLTGKIHVEEITLKCVCIQLANPSQISSLVFSSSVDFLSCALSSNGSVLCFLHGKMSKNNMRYLFGCGSLLKLLLSRVDHLAYPNKVERINTCGNIKRKMHTCTSNIIWIEDARDCLA